MSCTAHIKTSGPKTNVVVLSLYKYNIDMIFWAINFQVSCEKV